MKRKCLILAFLLVYILTGCSKVVQPPSIPDPLAEWKYKDILWMDDLDASDPGQDLFAVYARQYTRQLQLRVDILDLPAIPDTQLHFTLDVLPVGTKPENGSLPKRIIVEAVYGLEPVVVQAQGQPDSNLIAEIFWQTDLDFAVLVLTSEQFRNTRLKGIQVSCYPSGDGNLADSTTWIANSPIRSDQEAGVLLAFWDVMPGYSAAQTLRRWDGAHTGPFGQRHGLRYLLEEIENTRIPVILLDGKNPTSLAALYYLGQLERFQNLARQGLIILPDISVGDPQAALKGLEVSRTAGRNFGLDPSALLFAPLPIKGNAPAGYSGAFGNIQPPTHFSSWKNLKIAPLPDSFGNHAALPPEIDRDGLTAVAKKKLMQAALGKNGAEIVTFGGSLPTSPWADSQSAGMAFEYLHTHPWIKVFSIEDLLSHSSMGTFDNSGCQNLFCIQENLILKPITSQEKETVNNLSELREAILNDLEQLPDNSLSNLAWSMYQNLTHPTMEDEFQQLRANYLGNVGHIIAAAQWAQKPASLNRCDIDLDWDGANECILANSQVFTTYKLDGARLLFSFSRSAGEAYEWIGPLSQFVVGLSDPTEWKPEKGSLADPNEIPGAFTDPMNPFQAFSATNDHDRLIFSNLDGSLIKSFSLTSNSLRIDYATLNPLQTQIPITLYPSLRVTPSWGNCLGQTGAVTGFCPPEPVITANGAQIESISFTDSYPWMAQPENPSFGYPQGHYLPFPVKLLRISSIDDHFSIQIYFQP